MLDLVLRNGTVVDGTGVPGRRADVGIAAGRIVAIGAAVGRGERELDVAGLVVSPGFVDPHTHYDAQLIWDPAASPSNVHGVTTVMAGNCGFTVAPCRPSDADYLRRMLARVEGMPLAALEQGIDWDWTTFGEYLARLDGNLGVNAGFLVGHSAIRRVVMGEEATGNEATPAQVAQMAEVLRTCIREGGMGFSTSLSFTHSDGDGEPVASRWASRDEVIELCRVVSEFEGTTLELVTSGCMHGFSDDEVELMIAMSRTGQRPVNWNVLTVDSHDPSRYANQLGLSVRAAAAGARVVALTMPVLVGMNMSFGTYCALNMLPDWGSVLGLPLAERMAKLADPETRRFLETRAAAPEAGVFMRLTGWGRYRIGDTYSSANSGVAGRTVAEVSAARGTSDFDTLLDIVLADELRTILWPGPTDDDPESWKMRAEAWKWPDTLIGGSDAGAHLDRMCGAPYTTAFLADCIRGRQLATLEQAVRMLTDEPARLFGLRDRGLVVEGCLADLTVFDPATVDAGPAKLVADLPGGAARLIADAIGVDHVLVAGIPIVEDGKPTDARPGRTLRPGRDTTSVLVGA